jgi:hypothetical protein
MSGQPFALDRVDLSIQELAAAETAADLFRALLQATRDVAPRAAIFLVRQGRISGWNAIGYAADTVRRQRAFSAALGEGWLGQVSADTESAFTRRPAGVSEPDFGQPAGEAVAGALLMQGKPIAYLLAERGTEEQPWYPHAISLLLTIARIRLELTLATKKLGAARREQSAAVSGTPAGPSPPVAPAAASTDAAALAPIAEDGGAGQGPPEISAAQRFARLVATDIRLYNEEAVQLGRQNGDLVERLKIPLSKGKDTFLQRHGDMGHDALVLLHDALVQILAAGDDKLIPTSVLE